MTDRVLYKGELLSLELFWANKEPCLWIHRPEQRHIPKVEFVGGHPDEYCIFIKNLTAEEIAEITDADGSPIDIWKEIELMKENS